MTQFIFTVAYQRSVSLGAGPEIRTWEPESIEWFIEGQAFSRSYELAPLSPPPPFRPATHRKTEKERTAYWREEGEGSGWGAKSYDRRKPGILHIKHNCLLRAKDLPAWQAGAGHYNLESSLQKGLSTHHLQYLCNGWEYYVPYRCL
jgi:hypothetical protein